MSGVYILAWLAFAVLVGWAVVAIDEKCHQLDADIPRILDRPAPGTVRIPFQCDTCGRETSRDWPNDVAHLVLTPGAYLECARCTKNGVTS